MEPKPMTKERRDEVLSHYVSSQCVDGRFSSVITLGVDIADLLAAEQFWREAVKSATVHDGEYCPFCYGHISIEGETVHEPGCPWKAAQE